MDCSKLKPFCKGVRILASSLANLHHEAEKLKRDQDAVDRGIALKKREAEQTIKENAGETATIT